MKKNKKLIAIIFSIIIISLVSIVLSIGIVRTSVIKNVALYKTSSTSAIEETFEYSELENGTIEITKYVGTDAIVEIPSIINGKNVTSIGDEAFYYRIDVTQIEIPEGVTSIGIEAFYGCIALENISIPKTITTIAERAFYECTSLNNITIPEGVTNIGYDTFEGCQSLTQITIPKSVTNIGEYAFFGCISLMDITIPKNVTSIEHDAFSSCISLENINVDSNNESYCDINGVLYTKDMTQIIKYPEDKKEKEFTIPNEVTTICEDAFEYCSNLTNITIPNGVTTICEYAFEYCSNLTNITIPEGVTTIDYGTFRGCSNLTNITIPESVTNIESYALEECSNLKNITIPKSVTRIGSQVFDGCYSLENIKVDSDNANYCDVNGVLYTKDKAGIEKYPEGKKEKEYTIVEGVTTIGYKAFYECSSLNNIIIPESVTDIEDYAFEGCSSLTNIIIPEGITQINWNLFEKCTSLTNITIPNTVTDIKYGAFEGCTSLKNITIPKGVKYIGQRAFKGCSNLQNITIPEGVTTIGNNAFNGCSSLTNITIPEGIRIIEENVFKYCTSMTSVIIPESAITIDYNAFEGCSSLKNIRIPESVKNIYSKAFYKCSSLTNITISKNVTTIQNQAFDECNNLENINVDIDNQIYCDINGVLYTKDMTELRKYPEGKKEIEYTLPKSITDIESNALAGCRNLEKINVESDNENYCDINGVLYTKDKTEIVKYPEGMQETEFVVPNTVTSISWGTFRNCNNLISIRLPKSIINIEEGPFYRCSNLENIKVDRDNENYCDIDGILYSKDQKELISYPAGKKEIKFDMPNTVIEIWTGVFAKCNNLKEITISAGVKNLMPGSVMECENLTSVIIPEGVVGLMPFMFYGSDNIEQIVIPSSATAIFYFLEDEEYEKHTRATIYCKSDTIAEKYAKELNCPYVIDDEKPTVTITAKDDTLKVGEKITYTFTCSEPIVGFEAEDIIISDGEKGEFKQISKTEYTLDVTYNESGTKELSIQEGTYTDLVGNKNTATEPYTIRVVEPQSILVSKNPNKVVYNSYEHFDTTGMVVSIKYDNGDIEETTEYVIINGENLTCKVSKIQIQYNKDTTIKTELPITVGHVEVVDAKINPTCTKTGLTEGKHCEVCNTTTVEQQEISALGHRFTNYESNNDATCTQDGTKTAKCDRCDVTDKQADVGSKLPHNYQNGKCTECGIEEPKIKITSNAYKIEETQISKIKTKMTIKTFKENMQTNATEIKVYNKDGEEQGENSTVATGMTITFKLNNETLTLKLIVAGDVTGDGKADFKDMVTMNKHRLNKTALEGEYLIAGDITEDNKLDFKDIVKINKFRLNKIVQLFNSL